MLPRVIKSRKGGRLFWIVGGKDEGDIPFPLEKTSLRRIKEEDAQQCLDFFTCEGKEDPLHEGGGGFWGEEKEKK